MIKLYLKFLEGLQGLTNFHLTCTAKDFTSSPEVIKLVFMLNSTEHEICPADKNLKLLTVVGWLGETKVSCSFCHRGAKLILAYFWARPAVLAAGKGRVISSIPSLSFVSLFLPNPSLSSPLLSFLSLFSLSLGDNTK